MSSIVAGVEGIEPSSTVLETAVLPLNHTPMSAFPPRVSVGIIVCLSSLNKIELRA